MKQWRAGKKRAQVLVMVTLAMTTLVAAMGLAIDGGNMYAQRRITQNAADAAALAGTAELARAIAGETADVATNVTINVHANAGTTGAGTTVTSNWNFVDNADQNLGTSLNLNTNTGVQVTVAKTFPTFFMRIFPGFSTLQVQGTAAGKLQSLIGGSGPFLVCATGLNTNEDEVQLFNLTPSPPQPNPLMIWKTPGPGPGTPTPPTLIVHYSQLGQEGGNCGYGNQFKGPTDPQSPSCPSVPCWAEGNNGNTSNVIPITIQGLPSCKSVSDLDAGNCFAVLPIVVPSSTASSVCPGSPPNDPGTTAVCVRTFAVFQILGPSNPPSNCNSNCHKARMIQGAIVTGGTGGTYTPGTGGPLLIHLSS